MKILVLNCGSSSIKYALYNMDDKSVMTSGGAERVGLDGAFVKVKLANGEKKQIMHDIPEHTEGVKFIFSLLTDPEIGVIKSLDEIDAVGHRMVHGGEKFNKSVVLTDEVLKAFEECSDLAPLHNPANLKGVNAVKELMPGLPQVGVFDTANLATEHSPLCDNVLSYMINHGVENQLGMRVAIIAYALFNLLHVSSAEVSVQAGLACDTLQQLFLGVLAAEAQADEVGSRQTAGTLGREGPFAVEGVVGIDGTAVVVGRHADAAAHVADDEVQVFILLAYLLGKATGDGTLVQGMPDADASHERRTADTGIVVQLVDNARISNKRAATGNGAGNIVGNETTQIAGVIVHGDARMSVVEHLLIDFIDATGNGLHQTATSDDGIELQRHAYALQLVKHKLAAVGKLLDDVVELRQILVTV